MEQQLRGLRGQTQNFPGKDAEVEDPLEAADGRAVAAMPEDGGFAASSVKARCPARGAAEPDGFQAPSWVQRERPAMRAFLNWRP